MLTRVYCIFETHDFGGIVGYRERNHTIPLSHKTMERLLNLPYRADNWTTLVLQAVLSVAVIWGAWFFGKSKKLKKSDEDSATVGIAKEMIQVMDLATSGFKDELVHVRLEFKQLQDKYIELSIQVGVLTRENDRKDGVIESQKKKILELQEKILELEMNAA